MTNKINFNGKIYNSIEEMPPDVRQAYEQVMSVFADQNKNGVPDMFENMGLNLGHLLNQTQTTIVYEGKTYNSLEALPLEARQQYEQKMAGLDKNQDGMPDMFEGFLAGATMPQQPPPVSAMPTHDAIISSDSADNRLIIAGAVIFILLLAIAALAAYIFLL